MTRFQDLGEAWAVWRHALRHIRRGSRYLPGLGSHPGNAGLALVVIVAGLSAGAQGAAWMLARCGIAAALLAPLYCWAAWRRSIEYGQLREQLLDWVDDRAERG